MRVIVCVSRKIICSRDDSRREKSLKDLFKLNRFFHIFLFLLPWRQFRKNLFSSSLQPSFFSPPPAEVCLCERIVFCLSRAYTSESPSNDDEWNRKLLLVNEEKNSFCFWSIPLYLNFRLLRKSWRNFSSRFLKLEIIVLLFLFSPACSSIIHVFPSENIQIFSS